MRIAAAVTTITATVLCLVSADVNAGAARRGRPRQPSGQSAIRPSRASGRPEPVEGRSPQSAMVVPAATRLLLVAPHPDDETLGAGGLIQRVQATGGVVKVVYLTDGDGYPEGVRVEDHVESPTTNDYRGYG